jgi:2-dehydro-3-deoxyphosphogluconate aldolase/(4S)-4-hydroxy-2-oxoglutarate aldolase
MPDTRIVVTGGVQATEASVRDWIEAGAACLGFGSALVSRAHTDPDAKADIAALTPAVAAVIDLVAAARAGLARTSPRTDQERRP